MTVIRVYDFFDEKGKFLSTNEWNETKEKFEEFKIQIRNKIGQKTKIKLKFVYALYKDEKAKTLKSAASSMIDHLTK